ncbi:2Fe-2S iron-sulfur cluster binding domain-containing protein [Sinorhizobium meliloti]|uniref:xanthine dehydrogenase family Fe-S subunit n=1 Tax=Rhizobium meliloti TaxID=382 RepID=UPI000FD75114|nr:2Fe-2S iron-sulfur cluster-binding protein [Sinorhizobium meliloti]MDW9852006.1 2Fe-2S iron-sulfur cluster binding domain-containing protein [Sinorhizobium meliloti]MDW9870771.1 2Fe-2S iron-sulfur cluster binding domain-containing protein [Sinorhizobium meliloti]MDW9883413.1 2Fe-2S iron-sulfur cluster binding domain-containing protein [Sinorhizobium meliloti]MDX0136706.1 2Fe-2S iron-sulfur cluster binding domain-containing protein [Sinorhizobium meliloti]MDX0205063.1 2Fe-2S iron-sulfur clus
MNTVNLTINGKTASAACEPRTHLADFLRDTHNLTGTHIGCEHGVCGACTLLVDGVPTRSCITFAAACDGAEVTTVEGLDNDEIATELRAAFSREHGLQCGYCTPGMLVSARDVVLRMQDPTEHDIRFIMSGNLCRCTGYVGITRAIQSIIADRRARGIAAVPDGGRARLGPAGSGNAGSASAGGKAVSAAPSPKSSMPSVTTARKDDGWKPQTTFTQSFTVAHPADVVWEFFGRVGEVASCLPGASLTGEPVDGHVEGQIKVKVGPISAEFHGVADIARDDTSRTGTIEGAGKDKRSNSATRGRIAYAIKEGDEPGETRVDVTIGFTLTGMLAQFSRSGLVQDVANRLISVFVQNLEARLRHRAQGSAPERAPVTAEFDAGSLVSAVILGQIKGFFAKLFGRR